MLPHQSFDQLLQKYVNAAGKVNYKGFLADQEQLDAYLESLSGKSPQADWSRSKKLAHWINVYNAFTIRLILDHYPVNSIQDISGGKPWDKQWIDIGGQTYSLNQIENDIIRPRFGEPRIHFAVNCAAKSCPPLANKAFTEENLNTLLEQQTRAFINNPTFNSITANSLQISKIFDWYGVDFKNLIEFINKYAEIEISSDATVSYKDYNWNLNN
ncbi:MAG: DUF547 domain-containing protein [Saprospiraceae bacterium]|nr:DUF547 domain-containing protein [Saprospiraceae bacterium]